VAGQGEEEGGGEEEEGEEGQSTAWEYLRASSWCRSRGGGGG